MKTQTVQFVYSEAAEKAIEYGLKKRIFFRVLGNGPVPPTPFEREGWKFDILKSESITDSRILKRMHVLEEVVKPTMYLIAHEPEELPVPSEFPKKEKRQITLPKAPDGLGTALVAAGITLLGLAGVLAALAVRVALLDPIVIAILPDGTWLEVAWWYE